MENELLFSREIASLAWFVVGVIAGRFWVWRSGSGSTPGGLVEIYVGNLSYDTTQKALRQEFERFGSVESARIIKNKFNGKSKGFGFVEMKNRGEAENAIRALNGREIAGRRVVVNEAKSHPRD